jgi:GTP:adenosylcobinamide-phosphate guanylyltransferase
VELALADLPADRPVLVTTADHALLEARYVDTFLAAAREIDADVAIGLARADTVMAAVPGTRRTITRFSDGGYCGVNLFAFLTPAGRSAVRVWREVEAHRKRPARMMRLLGLGTLLRFALGRLSLDAALDRLSALAHARVAPVVLSYGRAAIDVDKPEDLALVRRLATAPGQAAAVDPPAERVPDPMSDRG